MSKALLHIYNLYISNIKKKLKVFYKSNNAYRLEHRRVDGFYPPKTPT